MVDDGDRPYIGDPGREAALKSGKLTFSVIGP